MTDEPTTLREALARYQRATGQTLAQINDAAFVSADGKTPIHNGMEFLLWITSVPESKWPIPFPELKDGELENRSGADGTLLLAAFLMKQRAHVVASGEPQPARATLPTAPRAAAKIGARHG